MFRVKCPCCGGILTVDERLRKVISHTTHEDAQKDVGEKFEEIVGKIEKAKSQQDARLDEAKRREADRAKHLDDLFKKAKDKAKDDPDEGKPRGPIWD